MASVQRKKCLAEEFYKEMLSFRNMEDGVEVDELVSKDMSTGWGRWLDFDIEACEEGKVHLLLRRLLRHFSTAMVIVKSSLT